MDFNYKQIYLDILNEEKSPTTFTPELLLDNIANKCFWSKNNYYIYTFDDILNICENDFSNYQLFLKMLNYQKTKHDFIILVINFSNINNIKNILKDSGYQNLHKGNKVNFSMQTAINDMILYFKEHDLNAANFNSANYNPELGCIIGVNSSKILSHRDLEKELDHEINHYFEQLQIYFNNEKQIPLNKEINNNIINILSNYYKIDFFSKNNFIENIKYHFFHADEFRSMSANVFHEILKYNENSLTELNREEFLNDIVNCNYKKYPVYLQEVIIFSYICHELSANRWMILLHGIDEALKYHKNIFQKGFIKIKDFLRKLV